MVKMKVKLSERERWGCEDGAVVDVWFWRRPSAGRCIIKTGLTNRLLPFSYGCGGALCSYIALTYIDIKSFRAFSWARDGPALRC